MKRTYDSLRITVNIEGKSDELRLIRGTDIVEVPSKGLIDDEEIPVTMTLDTYLHKIKQLTGEEPTEERLLPKPTVISEQRGEQRGRGRQREEREEEAAEEVEDHPILNPEA